MAFSNTYDTTNPGSAVSNRESLTDELTILAPEETPVLSLAQKGKAKQQYHEWTVDTLADPSGTAVLEGSDVTAFDDKFENQARLGNRCQKFRRTWKVSDEQEATDSVGPAGVARAEIKAQRELKRDIELRICSDSDRATGAAATASACRGLGFWLDTKAPSDVPSDYRLPSNSLGTSGTSTTESGFNTIIDSIYNQNGEVNRLTGVFATALRRTIADFTRSTVTTTATYNVTNTATRFTQSAESKKITLAVNMYDSDHGIVSLVTGNPKCMPATDRGYFLNTAHYGVDELIPMHAVRLENQGGGERGYVSANCTLRVGTPLAHGAIK